MTDTLMILPAYKPDEKMLGLIDALVAESLGDIMVVDDGSGAEYDRIFAGAADRGALVYRYADNMGKGFAIKHGIAQIDGLHGEYSRIVTADCDGQHTPRDIGRVIEASRQHPEDLVIGGRSFTGNVPARSRFGNWFSRTAFRMMTGVSIHDTQTGLRAIPAGALDLMASLEGSRYEYEMNMLLSCCDNGIHITEIPIETVYLEGNKSSHFRVIRDSLLIYKNPLMYAAVALSSFLIDILAFWVFSRVDALNASVPAWLGALFSSEVLLPTILARIISTSYNYTMNKLVVFRYKGSTASSLARYLLLAACIMCISAMLVSIFNRMSPGFVLPIKMAVDFGLFLCNYIIQKRFVFRKKRK